jgi:hypothetical protein
VYLRDLRESAVLCVGQTTTHKIKDGDQEAIAELGHYGQIAAGFQIYNALAHPSSLAQTTVTINGTVITSPPFQSIQPDTDTTRRRDSQQSG